jgi:serine/threonine protein kinase
VTALAGSSGDPADAEPRILSDRYRLVYKLGDGGMGSVWLAEDTTLERSVALKELIQRAGTSDLKERRTRALQEARAMARVRHPAIVPIHDVFFIHEDPWIVMEYISGRSLYSLIQHEPLDERSIARIGLHVLRGLIAVHRAGVVHRDVKPTNILVADDESIFLVDFGIARIVGDASLTGQAIVGTLEYLAPERFKRGYKVGPAADIWALGVTFYYALEGYSPFWRDSESGWEATMMAILKERLRPPSRGGELADITLRMLHKDPAQRADAHQVLAALEHIIGRTWPAPAPAPPSAREPTLYPAADPSHRAGKVSPARPEGSPLPHRPPSPPLGQPVRPNGDRPRYQLGDGRRGLQFDDAREMIKNVGTDTGVAMLLAMSEDDAARILGECGHRLCGALLQGIAAARPATAIAILPQLRSSIAGRAFAYLRPETEASLVTAMAQADALRLLENTDERTVAGVIMELPVPTSTMLLKSIYSRNGQRAAQVLTHVRPATAAELLSPDPEFASAVMRHLGEPVRKQVSRHLLSERTRSH